MFDKIRNDTQAANRLLMEKLYIQQWSDRSFSNFPSKGVELRMKRCHVAEMQGSGCFS